MATPFSARFDFGRGLARIPQNLRTYLQALSDLFDETTGHDHATAAEGAPIAAGGIDALAVDTAELAADAVDDTKLADNAVGNEHLQDSAVGTTEIANGAVTIAKVSGLASLTIAGVAGGSFDEGDGTAEVYDPGATEVAVLVLIECTEAIVQTTGSYDIGWDADVSGLFTDAVLAAMTPGDFAAAAAIIPVNEDIDVTIGDAGNITAGIFTITVLAVAT